MDADELRALRRKQHDFTDQLREIGWYHSFELPDGTLINGYMSLEWERERWSRFPIPADLTGKRVLDIGAWDGWFSFEAERRGAAVTSVDCQEQANYLYLHRKLGSKADYRNLDLFELPWVDLGKFDIVFCLGVLYHLRHPLWGLEILCGLSTELVIVETFVTDGANWQDHVNDIPRMEFYETTELNGNFDNWNGPTVGCVLAMCRAAGFARVELIAADPEDAVVACFRKWPPEPAEPAQEPPELLAAINPTTQGVNFNSRRDHDIDCWFRTNSAIPSKEELLLDVGEFGAAATLVAPDSGIYWAKFTLPPGLKTGWNDVRLRLPNSRFSAAQRIAIDMPRSAERIVIAGVRDSLHSEADCVNVTESGYLSCWVEGLPENADRGNLRLWLGDARMAITFAGEPIEGRRQINAKAPQDCPKGELPLRVECAGVMSEPVAVKVT
jgi:tRNA (mo5U34)-methyltransferase